MYLQQLEMPEKHFKMWRHHLYLFFGHCTTKNKDIALNFFMCVVCMYLDRIYSGVLNNLKFLEFIGNFLKKKWNFNFWGQNRKILKIRNDILKSVRFYAVWRFSIASSFKAEHSSSLQTFAFFTQNGETWRHQNAIFSKSYPRIFFWNFGDRLQIDAEEGTERFASISAAVFKLWRKSGRGGQNLPPPSGARVKMKFCPSGTCHRS